MYSQEMRRLALLAAVLALVGALALAASCRIAEVGYYSPQFTPDGVAVVHSIGRFDGPGDTNIWIQKYIFPGGYIPAVSEVIPAIEKAGLKVTDMEILRMHYARTLRDWRERFLLNRDKVKAIYDERFCRMWEYYLVGSEISFRYWDLMNFQIQFTRHQHALPITRDYMTQAEQRLQRAASTPSQPTRLAGE